MLLDGGTPKVKPSELREVLLGAGLEVGDRRPDFGVVVGGDGRFSRYGRTESTPLLFVGVRSRSPTGSKAYLAETTFDQLSSALQRVARGDYAVKEQRRLEVLKNGRSLGEVYTDAYLCRGAESTCIRYKLKIRGEGVSIDEAAIGDGVVFSTAAGATGYYSYPDRIRGERMDPDSFASIGEDEVGICHVTPTYTERSGTRNHPLRYAVPWGVRIEVSLFRRADARIYGTSDSRKGVKVAMGDKLVVQPGKSVTRVISLRHSTSE
ncbi:MAG TPA: hypothetical protein VFE91_07955 [Nitrososphaerales archaeon]|nr:hypothetical protein [Nitrososphaerales archaeon]